MKKQIIKDVFMIGHKGSKMSLELDEFSNNNIQNFNIKFKVGKKPIVDFMEHKTKMGLKKKLKLCLEVYKWLD